MYKKFFKRFLPFVLSVAMMVEMIPATAFAAEVPEGTEAVSEDTAAESQPEETAEETAAESQPEETAEETAAESQPEETAEETATESQPEETAEETATESRPKETTDDTTVDDLPKDVPVEGATVGIVDDAIISEDTKLSVNTAYNNLVLTGGTLEINCTVTVAGNLRQTGGTIILGSSGMLDVQGSYTIQDGSVGNGGDDNYSLSGNGTVKVGGDFVADTAKSFGCLPSVGGDVTLKKVKYITGATTSIHLTGTNGQKVTIGADAEHIRWSVYVEAGTAEEITWNGCLNAYLKTDIKLKAGDGFVIKAMDIADGQQALISGDTVQLAGDLEIGWIGSNPSKGIVNITGNLLHTSGTLKVIQGNLNVSGSYKIQGADSSQASDAVLSMPYSGSKVSVAGDFVSNTGLQNQFTAGTLTVGGNYTQKGSANSFSPYYWHTTVLNGAVAQVIEIGSGVSGQVFDRLDFERGTSRDVTWNGDMNIGYLVGDVALKAGEGFVVRSLSFESGSKVNAKIDGAVTLNGDMQVQGSAQMNITGDLFHMSGKLSVSSGVLKVGGSYNIRGADGGQAQNAQLDLEGGEVAVAGDYYSDTNLENNFSYGTLRVGGSYTQKGKKNALRSAKVVLDGAGNQTVEIDSLIEDYVFNGLEAVNGVERVITWKGDSLLAKKLESSMVLEADRNVAVPDLALGGKEVEVTLRLPEDGKAIQNGTLDLAGGTMKVEGALEQNAALNVNGGTLSVTGNLIQSQSAGLKLGSGTAKVGGDMAQKASVELNSGTLKISGDLAHLTGQMAVQTGTLEIQGSYLIQNTDGGRASEAKLVMANDSGKVKVTGNFLSNTDVKNDFLGGTLTVCGNYTQKSFANNIGGTHTTVLNGAEEQTVEIDGAVTGSVFNQLQVTGGTTRTIFWKGNLYVKTLTGNTSLKPDEGVTVRCLGLGGKMLMVEGSLIQNGAIDISGGTLNISGDLFQQHGDLTVNKGSLNVGGSYKLADAEGAQTEDARLVMQNEDDEVSVAGDFSANTSLKNVFAGGKLTVNGNYSQQGKGNDLGEEGTHRLVLNGANGQTVTVNVGQDENVFGRLEVKKGLQRAITWNGNMNVIGLMSDTELVAGEGFEITRLGLNGGEIEIKGDVTQNGDIALNKGRMNIYGSLNQIHGTMDVGGGTLWIDGSFLMQTVTGKQSDASLLMQNQADKVTVMKDFVMYTGSACELAAGELRIGGDFTQKGFKLPYTPNAEHRTILNGKETQKVTFAANSGEFGTLQITLPRSNYSFTPEECWLALIEEEDTDPNTSVNYTVTFIKNGHGENEEITVRQGCQVPMPEDPAAEGYEFLGWYKNVICTIPFDFENTTVEHALRIYADWEKTVVEKEEDDSYYSNYEEEKKTALGAVAPATIKEKTYDGNPYTPAVKVTAIKDGKNVTLVEGADYTLSYENNVNAGTGTVTVTGRGIYTGTLKKEFTIKPKSVKKLRVVVGSMSKGESDSSVPIHVYEGTTALTKGVDYTLSPSNIAASQGTKNVTIIGKGNYEQSRTVKVKVYETEKTLQAEYFEFEDGQDIWDYTGQAIKPKIVLTESAPKTLTDQNYTVKYANNKEAGIASVTLNGKKGWVGSVVMEFRILPYAGAQFKLKKVDNEENFDTLTYNGKRQNPKMTVQVEMNGVVKNLKAGKDYTVVYSNNLHATDQENPATVTVIGKGNYANMATKEFGFTITRRSINKATVQGTAANLKLTYAKRELVNGTDYKYEIVESAGNDKTKVKITGLGDFEGDVIKTLKTE